MLGLYTFLFIASAASANPARFECQAPEGSNASALQVLVATDNEEWSALDDSSRLAEGERTIKICRSPGCRDSSACLPFTGSGGIAFQRLGRFEFLPKSSSQPARVVLQGWNDADVGEHAKSLGGLLVYEMTDSVNTKLKIGTIAVTEQSEFSIVDDSLLVTADFVWGKGETRYEHHRFCIRIWNLRSKDPAHPILAEYQTGHRYPSFDEVDTIDVIRHELSRIRILTRVRNAI